MMCSSGVWLVQLQPAGLLWPLIVTRGDSAASVSMRHLWIGLGRTGQHQRCADYGRRSAGFWQLIIGRQNLQMQNHVPW